jgi:hypothetical protein
VKETAELIIHGPGGELLADIVERTKKQDPKAAELSDAAVVLGIVETLLGGYIRRTAKLW